MPNKKVVEICEDGEKTGYLGIQIDIMGPDNINIETEITKFNLTLLTALYRPHSQIRKNDKNENK